MAAAVLFAILSLLHGATAQAAPRWVRRLDGLVRGHRISVAVGLDGTFLYRHAAGLARAPGSNQKLLLSMAILDELGSGFRIPTTAAAASAPQDGVVRGDLWILGYGNPLVTRSSMDRLARLVAAAGVTRIRGSVVGSISYFRHDWFAPGWKDYFPRDLVALPSALTYGRNRVGGVHVRRPELLAARSLTARLEARGVLVRRRADDGRSPRRLLMLADIRSRSLSSLLRLQNVFSDNFIAEVLGKRLGVEVFGRPGTIAKGAAGIESWTRANGARVGAYDSSGLSYRNRVRAGDMVRLLWVADTSSWGSALRSTLPHANQGTLRDRLRGVRLRAKTGTLIRRSALSGWVWLERSDRLGQFSIISRGLATDAAKALEDRIVRIVSRSAS